MPVQNCFFSMIVCLRVDYQMIMFCSHADVLPLVKVKYPADFGKRQLKNK
jgi:hypothetical protein